MEKRRVGRPKKGETRKISITLPAEHWATIDEHRASGATYLDAIMALLSKPKEEN